MFLKKRKNSAYSSNGATDSPVGRSSHPAPTICAPVVLFCSALLGLGCSSCMHDGTAAAQAEVKPSLKIAKPMDSPTGADGGAAHEAGGAPLAAGARTGDALGTGGAAVPRGAGDHGPALTMQRSRTKQDVCSLGVSSEPLAVDGRGSARFHSFRRYAEVVH